MAYSVPSRINALLTDLAAPLTETAIREAAPLAHIGENATGEMIARSERVQGMNLAFQAMLRTPAVEGMTEFDLIISLATVCGTVMAQVQEPAQLYKVFQAQFAAVVHEVADAQSQRVAMQ